MRNKFLRRIYKSYILYNTLRFITIFCYYFVFFVCNKIYINNILIVTRSKMQNGFCFSNLSCTFHNKRFSLSISFPFGKILVCFSFYINFRFFHANILHFHERFYKQKPQKYERVCKNIYKKMWDF